MIIDNQHIDFTTEPLFFGKGKNVARLDLNIEQWTMKRAERALGVTWFPTDFSFTQDGIDYISMDKLDKNNNKLRQELFFKNLKFQTFLDSVATRSIAQAFIPVTTNPQLEYWWSIHQFQEAIHEASYAEIIKALPINATEIFDDIMKNEQILGRAKSVLLRLDELYVANARAVIEPEFDGSYEHKKALLFGLYALNILEGMLFQTSFITSWAFTEAGVMEGTGKTISRIAIDENNHLAMTQHLINRIKKEPVFKKIYKDCKEEIIQMYKDSFEADLRWIDYQFDTGVKLPRVSAPIMKEFAQYNTNRIMRAIGLPVFLGNIKHNPCKWAEKYVNLSNLQVALNETDSSNYLLGRLNKTVTEETWQGMTETLGYEI